MQNLFTTLITTLLATLKQAKSTSIFLKAIMLLLVYLEPIKHFYHLTALAVFLNFVLGWYTNKKLLDEKFNPKKARATVEKIVVFTVYISVIYLFENIILQTHEFYTTRVVAGILVLAELKSISENGDRLVHRSTFTGIYKTITQIFGKSTSKRVN